MAMFELEDSEDINLERCRTDGETLLKGKHLTNLTVSDCEVVKPDAAEELPKSPARKLLGLSVRWIMGIVSGLIVAAIATWLDLS